MQTPSRPRPESAPQPTLKLMPLGITLSYVALASVSVIIWSIFIAPLHPSDRFTWIELVGAGLFIFLTGALLLWFLRMVISRIQTYENALANSENRYQALFNIANDAMFVHRITADGMPGRFIDVNAVACSRLGYTRQEMLELTPLDIDTPEAAAGAPEVMEKFARNGFIVFEGEHRTKDGAIVPVEISAHSFDQDGTPVIFSIARDISERKKAEEDLRKLNRAIEQTPVAILIATSDGVAEYVNPAFTSITGRQAADVIGTRVAVQDSTIVPSAHKEDMLKAVSEGDRWQGEFENVRADGTSYWESIVVAPVKDHRNHVVNFVAVMEDITERRTLEDNMRHAQKMEAVGQLSGGIAHDFKNVLTVIGGYANLIKRKTDDEFPYRPYVEQIIYSCEKAINLTSGLLAFSRKQPFHPEMHDMNEIIGNVQEFLGRVIGEDIVLDVRLSSQRLPVMADATQVEQVLMNLSTNARDAMPDGGTITIATDMAALDEEFVAAHGDVPPGSYGTIMLRDQGEGIPPEAQEHIFEPFFTTKDSDKGTGLGLSIVYGIVRQHGGFITCESHEGNGTLFTIYLPIAEAGSTPEPKPFESTAHREGQETVLLVEDDDMVRNIMRALLNEYGYHVIHANSGADAIDIFARLCDDIDIMILDVIMPGTNGRQVYEACRGIRPEVKVLFISGYDQDIISTKGRLDEDFHFLSKPIIPAELLEKVRTILDDPAPHV